MLKSKYLDSKKGQGNMNIWTIIVLVSTLITIFISIVVYLNNPTQLENRIFTIFGVLSTFVLFTRFEFLQAKDYETAYLWMKLGFFWPLCFPLLLDFSLETIKYPKFFKKRFIQLLVWIPALLLAIIELFLDASSGLPIENHWGWINSGENQFFVILKVLWITLMLVVTFVISFRFYLKQKPGPRKNQSLIISITVAAVIIYGFIAYGLLRFTNFGFPDISILSYFVIDFFIGFGIWKYKLFLLTPAFALNNIINNMRSILLLTDNSGNIVLSNPSFQHHVKLKDRQIVNRHLKEFFNDTEF